MVGGLGADTMVGGPGDDTYWIGAAADRVSEFTRQGTDTVVVAASYATAKTSRTLLSIGSAPSNGTGNLLNNLIQATRL